MRLRLIGALAMVAACGGADAVDVLGASDAGPGATGTDASTTDSGTSSDASTSADGATRPDAGGGNPATPDPKLVSCGGTQCSRSGPVRQFCCYAQSGPVCQADALVGSCNGHRVTCDEKADCDNGVCCMEGGNERIQTRCLPTCITDAPRYQVCKTNGECESGSCTSYNCGSNMPALKFCQRPPGCN